MTILHRLLPVLLALVAILAPWPLQAKSPADGAASVALVDGGRHGDARLAAVVVRLADGWKTYWRVPGEGGLPPRFDFSASENVAEVQVLWPAPKRFSDPVAGETIGYKHLAVFPLLVRPQRPAEPVVLRLKMDYGVCGQMCVPMQARQELVLPPKANGSETGSALVRRWLARTPLADDGRLQVRQVRLLRKDGELALEMVLAGNDAGKVSDIFVEGVALAVFGRPMLQPADDGALLARIPVRGMAEAEDFAGKALRLTIVLKGEKAIERKVRLP